jgi:hypothetical protein
MQGKCFRQASEWSHTAFVHQEEFPSIASQQALIQLGSEHFQFDRIDSANIYPASRRAMPTRPH